MVWTPPPGNGALLAVGGEMDPRCNGIKVPKWKCRNSPHEQEDPK